MKLVSKTYIDRCIRRYDLAISVHHNFVANGVVVHNSSVRAVFASRENRMYMGSRTEWKRYDKENLWWRALEQNNWLEEFCREHPDLVVYGEVYGQVQSLKYGTKPGEYRIAVFDIMRGTQWVEFEELASYTSLKLVPLLYQGPFDLELLKELAEGQSTIPGANHIREGIVVKTIPERVNDEIGRVCLKLVSNSYLEKN